MSASPPPGDLRVEGLTVRVGDEVLFEGLTFSVGPEEALVVQGPSGSGKSRLLRALAGLDPIAGGTIRLGDNTPGALGMPAWRSRVTYVPQDVPGLPGAPADFLERVRSLAGARAEVRAPPDLAASWGLPPEKWEQPWSRLSGGERQRAFLAVAVARGPDVLLLDEPTSAMDPATVRSVEASLSEHRCVWVTHDPDQAARIAGPSRWLTLPGGGRVPG